MSLTPAQQTTLGTNISGNAATINGVAISAMPHDADSAFAIAGWYNQLAAVDFFGNYRNVPLATIRGAVTFKNYTPNDLPPASAASNAGIVESLRYLNRLVMAQTLQLNLNNLFLGLTSFDATNANLVAALKDATNTDMETGTAGAVRKGGWVTVQTVICRKATNAEKLFADTAGGNGGTAATAATLTFEGAVSADDIRAIWGI